MRNGASSLLKANGDDGHDNPKHDPCFPGNAHISFPRRAMSNEQEIALTVNILDGDRIGIQVRGNATVQQLKAVISEKTEISPNKQRLIYLGHQLKDEKALADYRIHDGVCIQLVKVEEPTPSRDGEFADEDDQRLQARYVVYLPIRITETTFRPTASEEHAIQGAPPVERYLSFTQRQPPVERYLSFTQRQPPVCTTDVLLHRLRSATENMMEESRRLDGVSAVEMDQPAVHSLIHSYERVVDSLSDFYHSSQGQHASSEEEAAASKEAIQKAIKAIGDVSSLLSSKLSIVS